MENADSRQHFNIMCHKLRKGQKRAKFEDVVEHIWEQMDDLGHDLRGALLVGPKGSTHRQVLLALKRIEDASRER